MSMRGIADKLRTVEQQLAEQQGRFALFALFLREGSPEVWDLVVSAPWMTKNESESLKIVATMVQESLAPEELTTISRIVVVDASDPQVAAIRKAVKTEHGVAEVSQSTFFGLDIRHAYIITSGSPI